MMRADTLVRGRLFLPWPVVLCGLLALSVLSGCGYKTRPVPPQEIVPKAVTDLQYELDDRGVTLRWTYPTETVKGDELSEILSFQLYRAVVPPEQYCETCPIPFGEPLDIPGGAIAAGKPRQAMYETTLLRPGNLYFFKVRSRTGWWAESEDSNIVFFMWNIPPAVPAEVAAQPGDGRVSLAWAAVTAHINGTPIREPVGYRVYRSQGGGPFTLLSGLLNETGYVDTKVVNGRKYRYQVQAVTMYEKGEVGGGPSQPVEAVPVDRTAPPPPAGVKAVMTSAGVKVVWDPVQHPDIRGYRVYRRVEGERQPVLLGEVKVPTTIFDDRTPPRAARWFYSVSSIDGATPANESPVSEEAGMFR